MDNHEIINQVKAVKQKIESMIETGHLLESSALLDQLEEAIPGDPDVYSMRAVIHIIEGQIDKAEAVLIEGLKKDSVHFDLLFNLAYIYEMKGAYQKATDIYCKAGTAAFSETQKQNLSQALVRIKQVDANIVIKSRIKIVFFVREGLDSFLGDILSSLEDDYWVRKIIVRDLVQIDEGMQWSDICWFEWCDELVAYGSKLPFAKERRIICRLHSYEAFTDYPFKVDWSNIDKVIFVAGFISDFVLGRQAALRREQIVIIPNGIDVSKYTYSEKRSGYNVAYVGYINYKKGPMLLLHTFKALYDADRNYKLYIAGEFQDFREKLYFDQMIREFGMEGNVIFTGWQKDLNLWLEDKDYILCTSILESQNVSVMQAMCKGIKPVIHNFVGARDIYPKKYTWNIIEEAIEMFRSDSYDSNEYREYITNNYSMGLQMSRIKSMLADLYSNKTA